MIRWLIIWFCCKSATFKHDLHMKKGPEGPCAWCKRSRRRPFARISSAELAHLTLQIILNADLAHQIELRFKKINVLLGVVENHLKQLA